MNSPENWDEAVNPQSGAKDSKDVLGRLTCGQVNASLEQYLLKQNKTKFFHLKDCNGEASCGCEVGREGMVDLIVLIDTSPSMTVAVRDINPIIGMAIDRAVKSCPTDLRVVYMGVKSTWQGTHFVTNHYDYLRNLHPTAVFAADTGFVGNVKEQGANAIEDLSNYFDWRQGACRTIFFIGDEELDGGPRGDQANENAATASAIVAANNNFVTVFAHHLTHAHLTADVRQNYTDLCAQTGGQAYFTEKADQVLYDEILARVICEACRNRCHAVKVPDLHPCISISWGDGANDSLETDDMEIMHITVCNCYSNVTFRNFSIGYLHVTNADGSAVAVLPDGTPSAQIVPRGPYCFGDIGPCVEGKPNCKSRQFVLSTRGAKDGDYHISLGAICYDVAFHYDTQSCFAFTLTRS